MDGNGRWAAQRNLTRFEGHKKGIATIRRVCEIAIRHGLIYMTLFGFSTENWQRPLKEREGIFKLATNFSDDISHLQSIGVYFSHVGRTDRLPNEIVNLINSVKKTNPSNFKLRVQIAFDYGGRDEIIVAIKKIVEEKISPSQITEGTVSQRLYLADVPNPDLLIRTSGEKRISNFLIWQAAYTELYFTDTLWPDFNEDDFVTALREYSKRQRRYGSV